MTIKPLTTKARFQSLRNSACGAVMMLALSACIPTDNASNETNRSEDFAQSQSQYYANAIQQYSMRSQHAMTNTASWLAGTVAEGTLNLASADFGSIDMGDAELFVESGYCKTSATDALHLTWYDSADEDGNFALKGIGAGKSGYIIRAIKEHVANENFGIFNGTNVTMSDGSVQVLPAGCVGLGIPNGSPVLLVDVSLPSGSENDMVRFEYRTVSCPSGETGAIQQQVQVTYHADGSRSPQGGSTIPASDTRSVASDDGLAWITTATNCAAEITLASYDVSVDVSAGIDFNALITSSGVNTDNQVAQILDQSLSNMECRRVVEAIQNGEDIDDAEQELFQTCGVSIELAALQSIGSTTMELSEEEIVTRPCGGTPGSFEDSVDGDVGIATHPAWTGEAVYRRETWTYSVNMDMDGDTAGATCGSCQNTESRERWTGLSLECSREEVLKIECETRLDQYSDREIYTPLTAGGFIYNRVNNISGWADPEELIPNEPDNPAWTGSSFDCSWRKDAEWDCSQFPEMTQVRAGAAWRKIEAKNIRGDVEVSDWTITSTARCEKERGFTCPGWLMEEGRQIKVAEILDPEGTLNIIDWSTTKNSQCCESRRVGSGCRTEIETRYYIGTAPGVGSWGPWEVVAVEDNCTSGGGSGGGGGGDGGGGDVCIMAGAQVAMADGSVKAIELLEVGDLTIAGRVLQKYARPYDATRHMTAEGRLRIGDSLYEVDGIVATGRHAYLSREGWIELSDSIYANSVAQDVSMLYNVLMENHVIPMVGASDTVHYYADELNNLGGVAEKAMIMIDGGLRIAA